MDTGKINHFKQKLESELALLETELGGLGVKEKLNSLVDWEPKAPDLDVDTADDSELADKQEEFQENSAVSNNLELRFNEVKSALQKIEEGKYGICEVCGQPIEEDRLEANPAAKTCKQHME
jgi:RNA polymerase-binding transcription factor DksA